MTERQTLPPFFPRLMKRTGGFYLLIAVLIVELVTDLLIAPAVALVQSNANLTSGELAASVQITLLFTMVSNSILLGLIYFLNRNAFNRLQEFRRSNSLPPPAIKEKLAWHEITRLPWRYGVLALASALLVVIGPLMFYQATVLHLTSDQIIYTLLGGFVAVLTIVAAGAIGIEWLMQPVREVLLPSDFETQVKEVLAINIFWKLQVFILAMVSTGIITLAPFGYRKIVQVVQGLEPEQALREYQTQSLVITIVILLLAAGLTAIIANLFSAPFSQLVETFRNVEQGQLHQRARVIATDEAGELEVYFNRMISRLESLQGSLEQQVAKRTAQFAAVNEVGQAVNAIIDPEVLIKKVVNLITDRFGHYYAALFLLDSTGTWAELKSATSEAGRVLLEVHHRLEVGGKSMVGSAISQKEARIALDVGAEPARFDNPLLPYTRSEIALPLVIGDRVIGALDVQSTKPSAFGPNDIETLQNMANQVAIALENARLFQETNQRLQELQTAQRQYLQQAWSSVGDREALEYQLGDDDSASADLPNLNVPLALRNQIIGSISLDGESEWTPEERAWVESVATQAAIALENARLMEESQKVAHFQRLIAEITGKIWSSTTRDGILQTAIRELGHTLGASEAVIELQVEAEEGASRDG